MTEDVVCRAAAIALTGLHGTTVMVEAAVSQQLPGMTIIGLPDTALAEAKLRVRTATTQAGIHLSSRFVTVNLSPAALPKHGAGFDLAIALAALAASRRLPATHLAETVHLGELGLGGELRRPAGLLSAAVAARRLGFRRIMVPEECGAEAALVPGLEVIAVADLAEAVAWYRDGCPATRIITPAARASVGTSENASEVATGEHFADISEIVGQPEAVEALVIAAAGRHHLSLLGPPGAGKTMLAMRLPTVLPELTDVEALEASSIASLGGTALTQLIRRPPFESPHHTASPVAIIGGGSGNIVRPGAVTRAHHGVLLMDEAPEFPRVVLDALRQPLETGTIEIHRSQLRTALPARVQLILAANPCPCGNAGSPDTALECRCAPSVRLRYQQRISGPLADRIDLHLTLHRVSRVVRSDLENAAPTSAELRARVVDARTRAEARLQDTPWRVNAEVPGRWLRSPEQRLPRADTAILDRALARGGLTLRGYDRVLRVAWTIADLAGHEYPTRDDVAQALLLRNGAER